LGDIITKTNIRVSTWLRTNAAPEVIKLLNGRSLITFVAGKPQPLTFQEIFIFTDQVMGFHLVPPEQEPLDYDLTEPNRYMAPVTVLIGAMRLDGHMRLSTLSNVSRYLDVTREIYTALYNVEITNLLLPDFGRISVPYVLVRQNSVVFTK
jgi:hypothetical protein